MYELESIKERRIKSLMRQQIRGKIALILAQNVLNCVKSGWVYGIHLIWYKLQKEKQT